MNKSQLIRHFSTGVVLSIIAKTLSMLITFVMLFHFGTNRELDIFITISGFTHIINFVVSKVYVNIVPPIYLNLENHIEKKQFIGSLAIMSIVVAAITFITFSFGGSIIVKLLAPGFTDLELSKSVQIIKILSISTVINIISSFFTSYLRTVETISPIYIREILINLIVLLSVYFFSKNITMISIYYVIAYFIAFLYLGKSFIQLCTVSFKVDSKYFRKFARKFTSMGIPILLTTCLNEIKNIIDKVFASYLQGGAISALDFSYRIIGIPVNIFGGVLVNVIFTSLITASKSKKFNEIIIKLSTIIIAIVIPLSFFVLFKSTLIASIFDEFNQNIDSYLLGAVMKAYSFCIFGNAMLLIMNTVFYAQGKTRNTLYNALVVTILNISFNSLFINRWGASGIAFATTLASLIAYILCIIIIDHELNSNILKEIISKFIILTIISIPSIIFLFINFNFISFHSGLINKLVELLVFGAGFIIIDLIVFIAINKRYTIVK